MIRIGRYRILHESEARKFEKLSKVFGTFSENELDRLISGTYHLHRNPTKREKERKEAV